VQFPTFRSFAAAPLDEVFTPMQRAQAIRYQVDTFASVYLENDGRGRFRAVPLPRLAQAAPINTMLAVDADSDGNLDLLVAGNLYDTDPTIARIDAGTGLWLRGDGRGGFTPVPPRVSGFLAPFQVSDLALVSTSAGPVLLVANSGDSLQSFAIRRR
jgi:hypothetical protein